MKSRSLILVSTLPGMIGSEEKWWWGRDSWGTTDWRGLSNPKSAPKKNQRYSYLL